MALSVPEKWFWPAKTRKNWIFLRCLHFFWPGAQNLFRHKWRKQASNSLFFPLYWRVELAKILEWVFCASAFWLKFSRFALLRKRLQLDSKTDLITNRLILKFFIAMWFFSLNSDLYGLKFARIAQTCFPFGDVKIFLSLVWGVFWSFLQKCLYFLAVG